MQNAKLPVWIVSRTSGKRHPSRIGSSGASTRIWTRTLGIYIRNSAYSTPLYFRRLFKLKSNVAYGLCLCVDTTCLRQYNSMSRRSGGMADALRSGRSTRKGVRVQISPSAPFGACSSVGLERSPAKAEVVGSSPTKRTISSSIHIRALYFNWYFLS